MLKSSTVFNAGVVISTWRLKLDNKTPLISLLSDQLLSFSLWVTVNSGRELLIMNKRVLRRYVIGEPRRCKEIIMMHVSFVVFAAAVDNHWDVKSFQRLPCDKCTHIFTDLRRNIESHYYSRSHLWYSSWDKNCQSILS